MRPRLLHSRWVRPQASPASFHLSRRTRGDTARSRQLAGWLTSSLCSLTDAVYVDEATGDDKDGDGSQAKPFKTVAGAYIARSSDAINVHVRQAPAEGQTEGSWAAATASAKKKAAKLLQTHKNKLAKQEELRKREEAEGEARRAAEAKKLEEAKAIVLEEPTTEATRIKIRQATEQRGKRVRVFGWVHRLRQQGGMTFVILRDGSGYLQCVLSGRLVRFQRSFPSFLH